VHDHDWLEDIEGERALEWVRSQNQRSLDQLESESVYADFEAAALEVLTSRDRIPYGAFRGEHVYNFWQDDEHVRGIWRRSPIETYLADDPIWETLLDIDELAVTEGENWVYAGANPCRIAGRVTDRVLVSLSIGGRDASTMREFDICTKTFVEDGFVSPEAKQNIEWVDLDTVLVATDWGTGTLSEAGYPLSVRRWVRGESLADAHELFRGEATDMGVWPMVLNRRDGTTLAGAVQRATFFTGAYWLFPAESDEPLRIPIPDRADIHGAIDDQLIVTLREDWQSDESTDLRAGDLISFDLASFLQTGELPPVHLAFRPGLRQAVQQLAIARDRVLLNYSDNVVSRLAWLDRSDNGDWQSTPVALPTNGEAMIMSSDEQETSILVSYQGFLSPDSSYVIDSIADSGQDAEPRLVRCGTAHFDAQGLTVDQRTARSSDGTEIPYFLVHRDDMTVDGSTPTLLYGYGGFEVSMTPSYSSTIGRLWLERGGAYALANIRGGGEFGPAWHQAGLKQKRQVIYDDFIAVAEQLIADGVTAPERLGIMGGSNGGLLMGVMLTQRPELWNAVVVQVPLLDMLRYHQLLAGASWIDEYGSPDVPEERAFLETISPYHRFDPAADYPTPFFVTSTKDDRVHPAHARKMAKRFDDADKAFLYFENIDGGHGGSTTQLERARRIALEFTYLTSRLMT
jgi:prolyl oligopeptidase